MKYLTILLLFVGLGVKAQKLTEYKAVNGITYKIGDTVLIGKGSGTDGKYVYMALGGKAGYIVYKSGATINVSAGFNGIKVIIVSMKNYKLGTGSKTFFFLDAGNKTIFTLIIDDAISACEVLPCKKE